MEFVTEAQVFYKGYKMPLWHQAVEDFTLRPDNRFRLILVKEGTALITVNNRRSLLIAPVLVCLNETDEIQREGIKELSAEAFYFHPEVVNSAFQFGLVHNPSGDVSTSTIQDLVWLDPFVKRNETHHGCLPIGPVTMNRILFLMKQVQKQLDGQPDQYWPCRSRTAFLELLFLVRQVYENKETVEMVPISDLVSEDPEIDPIILFLHINYRRRITIGELTQKFHINRTTLTQKFTETTGVSVMTYLLGIRIRVASLILRDTTLPVAEVMERVGFNDPTHFGRTFRKYTGISPTEYRQQYCWMIG